MVNIPHLLLAAGDSRRMGQPKQLLPWGDKTLIEHQIQIRLQTEQNVIVVLGGNSDKILPVVENLPVTVLVNDEWANGMGSSIVNGIKRLKIEFPIADGVLISLLDQPLITTSHLDKMVGLFKPGSRQIIVSQSASGWSGVPALFDKLYFKDLKNLNGDEGARKIIKQYLSDVLRIECGNILEDIDTPESYQQLLNNSIR